MMRNQFEADCAICGTYLPPERGWVQTQSRRRPYPVLCDSCLTELAEDEQEAHDPGDLD